MDFFNVLSMAGGLALFLYGMNLMGDGLAKVSGGKLESILARLTSNPLKAALLGAAVTAVIQSSTATTVMVVGFVNSGLMQLSQTVGIIMGANVGTTITSWILSLSGIESNNFFIRLLKPTSFSPVLALIGVILLMFSKKERKKDIGAIFIGFAILMFGMETMSQAVEHLKDVPEFTGILTMFSNPVLGLIAGAVLTAVIQSSSASVGILQALCTTGNLNYETVIPITMGQNIGTCVTALLSSVGASKNARRTAFIHLYFNVIGTLVFMIAFYLIHAFRPFEFLADAAGPAGIAAIHSLFNVTTTIVLLPFSKLLVKLATLSVIDNGTIEEEEIMQEQETELNYLDERFLDNPAFALMQCDTAIVKMTELTKRTVYKAVSLIENYDETVADEAVSLEERVDHYEDVLGNYFVRLSKKGLNQTDIMNLSKLQHLTGDLERINDLAISIVQTVRKMQKKEQHFSKKARKELKVYIQAVTDILELAVKAFTENDKDAAECVAPLEGVIEKLAKELKKRHMKRLKKGKCSVEMGFVLSDISSYMKQIAVHCDSIGVCVIQDGDEDMAVNEYNEMLDKGENTAFQNKYLVYKEKYILP